MDENSDHEVISNPADSTSESENETNAFHGFDITDVRGILNEAKRVTLFTSAPQKIAATDSGNEDFDGKVLLETAEDYKADTNKTPSDSDSDISGELTGSLFYSTRKKPRKDEETVATISASESESDLEGEIFLDTEWSSTDENEKIQPEPEANSVSPRSKKRGNPRSTILKPEQLLEQKCCSQMNCFSKLSLAQIQKARANFCQQHPTFELQRKMILNWLESNQPEEGRFCYYISGIPVCWKAWTNTLGITKRRFQYLKNDYLNGRRNEIHGSFLNIPLSDESDKVIRFLEKYFSDNCDYMPNSKNWHLPSSIKKIDVYVEMCIVGESEGLTSCSEALFRKIWNRYFSHVKIPKENRFGKCDTCSTIKDQIKSTAALPMQNVAVQQSKRNHLEFVRKERTSYMDRAAKAHQQPNKSFSIAIDGMDQNKTEIPFTVWRHSTLEKSWRLKVHIVGALIHGRHPIMFIDYQQLPHDSNLTCNILMQACWVHKDLLPGTINIQLDNTCKENKNQFVFSFLSYLVETEVFDKIEVSFLPVGHTHIDVDQMFSRLSVAISRRGAKTYQDLLRHIRICHNQNQGEVNQEGAKPQFARIDNVYAIREWLQPCCKEMHALRDFHQFAFVRNDQGQCIIDFKPWCSGSSWDRQKWKPLGPILQELPQGIPDLIKPNFEVVGFERIKKTVEKCGEMGILNSHEVELWHDFLAEEKDYCEVYENIEAVNYNDKYHKQELQYVPCTETRWLVDDLRERKRPNCDQTVNLCDALKASEAYERGDGFLPAYTGPYRPRKETQRDVIEDQNTEDLEVGMLVALDLEQYRERPLIGVVREIMEDNILISWYGGSWSTKWSLAKKKEGRQWVEWLEEVESKYVVLFDFNFTNKGKLRLPTIRHLKDVYSMSEESEEAESDN